MTNRRSVVGWLSACGVVPLLAVGLANLSATNTQAETTYTVYNTPVSSVDGSEIVDITPDNKYAMVVGTNNSTERKLRAVTIDPTSGLARKSFDFTSAVPGTLTNPVVSSVAMHPSGYAVVTVRQQGTSGTPRANGAVIFIQVDADGNMSLARSTSLQVGIDPNSVDVASNGQYAVVANADYVAAQNGSISLIDLRSGPSTATVTDIPISLAAYPDAFDKTDAGPETVAISPNSERAYVTLQRNNVIAAVSINASLGTSLAIETLPRNNNIPLRPDGIAVTPDNNYVVTANEGAGTERSNTVSLLQVNADNTNPLGDPTSIDVGAADARPEMVATGNISGVIKAFVTLPNANAVSVFNINPGSGTPLVRETNISLNPGTAPFANNAQDPEGIAVADLAGTQDFIVTANVDTTNVSVIRAVFTSPSGSASSSPSASPSTSGDPRPNKGYLPDIRQTTNP